MFDKMLPTNVWPLINYSINQSCWFIFWLSTNSATAAFFFCCYFSGFWTEFMQNWELYLFVWQGQGLSELRTSCLQAECEQFPLDTVEADLCYTLIQLGDLELCVCMLVLVWHVLCNINQLTPRSFHTAVWRHVHAKTDKSKDPVSLANNLHLCLNKK